VLEDGVEVGGAPVPRGEKLALLFGSANRDPRVFVDADRLDVGRGNAAEHIGFGGGIHVCIGAPLARIELAASFEALAELRPTLHLVEQPQHVPAFVIRGYQSVRVAA
jgi:cytochrome P450